MLDDTFGDVFNDTLQQNGRVNVTNSQYDGQDRLIAAETPEQGTTNYTYSLDLLHNLIQVKQNPKPGSPLSPLITSYAYDPVYNKPTRVTDPLGLVATYTYDPATGNLVSTVADTGGAPHFNATSRFTYDGLGHVLTATDPLQTVTQYAYDSFGNPTSVIRDSGPNRLNQLTTMAYGPQGDVISVTDPNGHVTTSSYDASRRLLMVTTPGTSAAPNGVVTAYSYDPDGRLLQTQQSANAVVLRTASTTYTLTGQRATATDANGNVTSYAYDTVDRLSGTTDAMARTTVLTYDTMSRRTAVLNMAIQSTPLLQLGYTPDGLLGTFTDANSHATNFAYDGLDRLSTSTYPDSSTETLTYDADGNVLTRKTRAGQTISYTYDTLNRLATKTPPLPAAVVTYSYDLASRLKGVSDTSAAIAAAAPPGGSTVSYTTSYAYDALNRPITINWTPAPTAVTPTATSVSFAHTYNKTNQRSGQTTNDNSWWFYPAATAGRTSYTANNLNQYSAVGSISPTYDGNGNLTYDGTFTYGYDAENRLTSVTQGGMTVATYAFDAQARRKLKTVGSASTIYVTDADNREVLEYNGTCGTINNWYAYGLGPNGTLNQLNVVAGTRATFIPDIQGSILATLDSGTGALSKFGYLAYGKSNSIPATFGYTGQRADPETNGLYYYRARMYIPAWGRFMQPDPLGYAADANLYVYVGDDPLNNSDPNGIWGLGIIGSASIEAGLYYVGAGATGSVGGGLFGGGSAGTNVGGFVSGGAFVGGPGYGLSAPAVPAGGTTYAAGAYAGGGVGVFYTNATSPTQLKGPFNTLSINTPFFSIQIGESGGTFIISATCGVPPCGGGTPTGSVSVFPTNTIPVPDTSSQAGPLPSPAGLSQAASSGAASETSSAGSAAGSPPPPVASNAGSGSGFESSSGSAK